MVEMDYATYRALEIFSEDKKEVLHFLNYYNCYRSDGEKL